MDNLTLNIYKTFGIQKDMPPRDVQREFPEHKLSIPDCETGRCLSNAFKTALENSDLDPHIVHGKHVTLGDSPHAWVEYHHRDAPFKVHDTTPGAHPDYPKHGYGGSEKDMYSDDILGGKPLLTPTHRYSLMDYVGLALKAGKERNVGHEFFNSPEHAVDKKFRGMTNPMDTANDEFFDAPDAELEPFAEERPIQQRICPTCSDNPDRANQLKNFTVREGATPPYKHSDWVDDQGHTIP